MWLLFNLDIRVFDFLHRTSPLCNIGAPLCNIGSPLCHFTQTSNQKIGFLNQNPPLGWKSNSRQLYLKTELIKFSLKLLLDNLIILQLSQYDICGK